MKKSLVLYGIPNCDTVKKARIWLESHGIEYRFHDYKKEGADRGKLEAIDEVAGAITRSYSRQRIIVEGHTDDTQAGNPSAPHLLTGAQAQAVFTQLIQRGRLPARQLSILAMGENHPLASNATPAGKAKNRRIEIVVYPDAL